MNIIPKIIDRVIQILTPKTIYLPDVNPFQKMEKEDGAKFGVLAAQHLIRLCIESDATCFTADLDGFSIKGKEQGDWRVTMEKINDN